MLTIEIGVLVKMVLSFITKYFLRQLPQLTSCRKFFCSRHLTKRTCFGPQTRSRLFALIGRAIVISSVAVFAPSSSACFLYTIVRVSSWNEKHFFLKVVIIKGVVDGVAQLHSFNRQFCIRFYLEKSLILILQISQKFKNVAVFTVSILLCVIINNIYKVILCFNIF